MKLSTLLESDALVKPIGNLEKKLNELIDACYTDTDNDDDLDDCVTLVTKAIKNLLSSNYDLLVTIEHKKRKDFMNLLSNQTEPLCLKLKQRIKSTTFDELTEQLSTLKLVCDTDFNLKPLDFAQNCLDSMTKWKNYEDQLISLIETNKLLDVNNDLVSKLNMIKDGRRRIAITFLGSLKSTKSGVANFLVGKEVCPTADAAATALLTKITYGERIELTLLTKEGQGETKYYESYDKLLAKATEYIVAPFDQRSTECKDEVIIKLPIEELKGVELWDIPGFDENQVTDNRVKKIISDADLIFALMPYREAFRDTFRKYIESFLASKGDDFVVDQRTRTMESQKICFLVTQIDTFTINTQTGKDRERVLNDLFDTIKRELHIWFDADDTKSCDNFIPMCTHQKHHLKAFLECRKDFVNKSRSWFVKGAQSLKFSRLQCLIDIVQKLYEYGDSERIIDRCIKLKKYLTEYFQNKESNLLRLTHEGMRPAMNTVRQSIPEIMKNCNITTCSGDPNQSQKIDEIIKQNVIEKVLEVFEMKGMPIETIYQNMIGKRISSKLSLAEHQLFEQILSEVSFDPYKEGLGYFDKARVFGATIYNLDTLFWHFATVDDQKSMIRRLFDPEVLVKSLLTIIVGVSRLSIWTIGKFVKPFKFGETSQLEDAVNTCIVGVFQALETHIVDVTTKYWKLMYEKMIQKLDERVNNAKSLSDTQKEHIKRIIESHRFELGKLYLDLLSEQFKLNYPNLQINDELLGKSNFEIFSSTIQDSNNTTLHCAAKKIPLNRFNIQEVRYLNLLDHPNIVKYYGVTKSKSVEDTYYIIMDRMDGDLKEYFERHSSAMNEDQLSRFFIEITTALAYIHREDLVHRDIKPQNILYKNSGEHASFYLSDFGLVHRDPVTFCGTLGYAAPEVTGTGAEPITHKADVYSWGVTIKNLIDCLPKNTIKNSKQIQNWQAIANKCTQQRPDKRPSCQEILMTLESESAI